MILKELIEKFSWTTIAPRFFEMYPESETLDLESVWKEINDQIPVFETSNMVIHIEENNLGIEVFGKDGSLNKMTGQEETFALEMTPWEKWLGMRILEESLKKYSEVDIICFCVYEMTAVGLNQLEIQKEIEELNRRIKDLESGKAELIPWEEVKEKIKLTLKNKNSSKESDLFEIGDFLDIF